MSQDQINHLLQQGIAAARENQPDVARGIFQQVLQADPRNEIAWAWLASIARDNRERLIFLRKLLEVNPQNEFALKGLRALGVEPEPPQPQGPPSAVPYLDDRRFARIQQATDEFLRSYTTAPADHLNIAWERQQRNRYGEGGAKRLQQMIYAGATVAVLAVVAVIVLIISQLDISLGGGDEAAFVATAYTTATPRATFTPTPGGPTPTAFPSNPAFAATTIPEGLEPGDPDMLMTPTEINPPPNRNSEPKVKEALGYFTIGDYGTAIEILSRERELEAPACFPYVVYFEALSRAYNGDLDEAYNVLDWARNNDPGTRVTEDCLDSPLILAGLAEVFYLEDPRSDSALSFSTQALDDNPDLIPAVVIKGRVEMATGQITTAWQTVHSALDKHPEDTNLLLLAAEIELANAQPATALEYIGAALYIDPDLLPGLYLQTDAYLQLAEQSETNRERMLQGYGLAVRSAQLILQYYEGDVRGYLYLAKARLGEGNDDLAEDALTRILAVNERLLPDSAAPVIDEAYLLLGNLYYAQGRFADAQEPLNEYVDRRGLNNVEVLEKLVYSALAVGDYPEASEWINRLLALPASQNNPQYRLLEVQLLVETCTFYPEIVCDYDDALTILSDMFINGLRDEAQRARALTYRAEARYHNTLRQGAALSASQQQTAFQQALTDITQALNLNETAIARYYRGLLLEALNDPVAAFEEYQWVAFWNDVYDYPFVDANFETRFAATGALVQGAVAEVIPTLPPPLPTNTPDITTPTPRVTNTPQPTDTLAGPTPTPGPTDTPGPADTPSPTPTMTPTPQPTDIPSADIP